MNLIQDFKHNRALSKEFDIHESTPSPTLANEIQPVVVVADLSAHDPFLGSQTDDYIVSCGQLFLGVVTLATVQLLNPVGSGVILELEKLILTSSASSDIFVSIDQPDYGLGIITQGTRLYRRQEGGPQYGRCGLAGSSQATIGGTTLWMMRLTASTWADTDLFHGLVLDEGRQMTIQQQTAASTLYVNARWRENVKRQGR